MNIVEYTTTDDLNRFPFIFRGITVSVELGSATGCNHLIDFVGDDRLIVNLQSTVYTSLLYAIVTIISLE